MTTITNVYPPPSTPQTTPTPSTSIQRQEPPGYRTLPQSQAPSSSSFLGTIRAIFSGVQEIGRFGSAAASTARAERGDDRTVFTRASDFGDLARTIFEQFLGSKQQNGEALVDSIGQTAQAYLHNSVKDSLINEATQYFGYPANSLSLNDFLDAGLNWVSSGFEGSAFTNSLDAASIANQGAAEAIAGETQAAAGGITGTAGTILGGIGAAYSAYNLFKNWGNGDIVGGAVNGAATGAYIGSIIPGVGTAIGGVVGGLIGAVSGLFKKSGKSKDQLARDKVRGALKENGMLPDNNILTLANGSSYDIGKDGGFKLVNVDGTTRHAYDVDFKNPLAERVVGMAQSFVSVLMGGDQKLGSDFTGYVVNAALSNATTLEEARANVLSIFKQFKLNPETVLQGIASMVEGGAINEQVGLAYANGLKDLFTPDQSEAQGAAVQ